MSKLRGIISNFRNIADRYCTFDHCRLPMPWFAWHGRNDHASLLRLRILEIDYGAPLSSANICQKFLAACLHLTRVTRELLIYWNRFGAACKTGFSISHTRQIATMLVSTFRYNFPPSLYYRARLFRIPRSRWLSIYSHEEIMVLMVILEKRPEHQDLWTKSGWGQFCENNQMPSVPVLAYVTNDKLTIIEPTALQGGQDLFLKPDDDWASHGTVMLEWKPQQKGWQAIGTTEGFVPRADINEFIVKASHGDHTIVQPRLRTHQNLADLVPRALINFRVVTLCSPNGEASIFSAALRIALGEAHSSDVPGSAFYIPLDTTSGELGYAESPRLQMGLVANHPLTKAPIKGRKIDQWPEMKAQALAAHAKVPSVPIIGWDVVPTEQGVLILEANVVWSTNLTQLRGLAPLGESNFPTLMLKYLDSLPA